MDARTKKALLWTAAGVSTAALTYHFAVRPWHKRWGAEPIDIKRPMAGDEIVADANEVTNRAITINAEPGDIWPWLVQFAAERRREVAQAGGERKPANITPSAAEELRPEYQSLNRGDILDMGPAGEVEVADLQEERWLVLAARNLPAGKASWSIVLNKFAADRTRVVCRTRLKFGYQPRQLFYRLALDPLSFLVLRRWFLKVRDRAEQTGQTRRRLQQERERGRGNFIYGHQRQHPSGSTS